VWLVIIASLHLLGLASAIRAMKESRTSQGAIAWVIFLITFPYISLPVYWIFGRNRFRGYTTAMQVKDKKEEERLEEIRRDLAPYIVSVFKTNRAEVAAEKLAYFPLLRGNHVKLLIDGDATFDSIIEGIGKAQEYILFQFFIVKDDGLGRRVKEALIAKAKEGISVYFLYDEVGSHSLPGSYIRALKRANVEVYPFHTRKGWMNKFQINFRNHRKVVVTDGRFAWIGGHNVGDEYLGLSKKFGHWRDTHVRIEGPAVLGAQLSFLMDWHWATGRTHEGLNWKPVASAEGDQEVLIVPFPLIAGGETMLILD